MINLIALLFLTSAVRAENRPLHPLHEAAPPPRIHWVSADGDLMTISGSHLHSAWVWDDSLAGANRWLKGGPALRIEFDTRRLQHGWSLHRVDSDSGQLLRLEPVRGTPDFHVVLLQFAATAVYDFELAGPRGQRKRHSLVVSVPKSSPAVFSRKQDCLNQEFILEPDPEPRLEGGNNKGRHLFVALSCFEDFWNVTLYLRKSNDAQWAGLNDGTELKIDPQAPYLLYKIDKNADNFKDGSLSVHVSTIDQTSMKNRYILRKKPSTK